jgi:hypothetical protein
VSVREIKGDHPYYAGEGSALLENIHTKTRKTGQGKRKIVVSPTPADHGLQATALLMFIHAAYQFIYFVRYQTFLAKTLYTPVQLI